MTSWRATSKPGNADVKAAATRNGATWEHFGAVKPSGEQEEPDEINEPATEPIGGSGAWEDGGTLKWELWQAREAVVPGFVTVQVDAYTKGVQPQDRQLVVAGPNKPYDMGVEMGVSRREQWWYQGTPPQFQVVNRAKASLTLKRGGLVARIYAVNTSDKERMKMLCDPAYPASSDTAGAGSKIGSPAQSAQRTSPGEDSASAGEVDFTQVNITQTKTAVKGALMRLLERYRPVFAANPKVVTACNQAKMQLPLVDSKCTPHAAKQSRYSPEETAMKQSEITELKKAGTIRRPH